jgi:hypothetical protein
LDRELWSSGSPDQYAVSAIWGGIEDRNRAASEGATKGCPALTDDQEAIRIQLTFAGCTPRDTTTKMSVLMGFLTPSLLEYLLKRRNTGFP